MSATAVTTFDGGVSGVAAGGTQETITVSGTWQPDDNWSIILTDVSGSVTIGVGTIYGVVPQHALTLDNKLYFVAGGTLYFSAVGDPTAFDPQDVGSGFIIMTNGYAATETLVATASYQGRIAVFSRRTSQIWTIDADPTKYAQSQVLANIGTLASLSVQSFGDMDVFFLSDSGLRSLRVRDSSLNAFVSDIGSAIDFILIDAIAKNTGPICAIVEPTYNRYWLSINGNIYVLSYFPSSKVTAWSTYLPTYQASNGVQTLFTPEKFCVVGEQVWCRATDGNLYLYGGLDGATYDNTTLTIETPWMDAKKPGTVKSSRAVDVSTQGSWTVYGTMDYWSINAPKFWQIISNSKPTFDQQTIPFADKGTHIKFRFINNDAALSVFSMLIWHYKELEEK